MRFKVREMNKLLYILLLLFALSCTTQKKCYEKFPPKPISSISDTIYLDTIVYVSDTVKVPEISFKTDYFTIRDTVIQNDTVQIVLKTKGDKVKIECNVKELQYIIDSLEVKFQKILIEKKQIEQVYFDQKAELKKIRAERKPLVQQAKAKKWQNIADSLIYLIIFIIISATIVIFFKHE